jgi:hypothetical protein
MKTQKYAKDVKLRKRQIENTNIALRVGKKQINLVEKRVVRIREL